MLLVYIVVALLVSIILLDLMRLLLGAVQVWLSKDCAHCAGSDC